jgi:hypothetical protein
MAWLFFKEGIFVKIVIRVGGRKIQKRVLAVFCLGIFFLAAVLIVVPRLEISSTDNEAAIKKDEEQRLLAASEDQVLVLEGWGITIHYPFGFYELYRREYTDNVSVYFASEDNNSLLGMVIAAKGEEDSLEEVAKMALDGLKGTEETETIRKEEREDEFFLYEKGKGEKESEVYGISCRFSGKTAVVVFGVFSESDIEEYDEIFEDMQEKVVLNVKWPEKFN